MHGIGIATTQMDLKDDRCFSYEINSDVFSFLEIFCVIMTANQIFGKLGFSCIKSGETIHVHAEAVRNIKNVVEKTMSYR